MHRGAPLSPPPGLLPAGEGRRGEGGEGRGGEGREGRGETEGGYGGRPRGAPRCPEVPRGAPRCPKVPRGAPRCPKAARLYCPACSRAELTRDGEQRCYLGRFSAATPTWQGIIASWPPPSLKTSPFSSPRLEGQGWRRLSRRRLQGPRQRLHRARPATFSTVAATDHPTSQPHLTPKLSVHRLPGQDRQHGRPAQDVLRWFVPEFVLGFETSFEITWTFSF
jgi:hypothetical protein